MGTALAQLVLFRVIQLFGARKLSLVTYLIPAFALAYGALILDESITPAALGGLALILIGVALALGSGALRAGRRPVEGSGTGAVSISLRRAEAADAGFLVALVTHEEVAPFLAASRPRSEMELLAEIERSETEPEAYGVFVIEVDGTPAGTCRSNGRTGARASPTSVVSPSTRRFGAAASPARRRTS